MIDPASEFRAGFDALLEDAPDPPMFEDIATGTLEIAPRRQTFRLLLVTATAALAIIVVAANVWLSGPEPQPITQPTVTETRPPTTPPTSLPAPSAVAPLFGQELPWTLVFDDGLRGVVMVDLEDSVERKFELQGQRPGDAPYRIHLVGDHLIAGWGEIFAVGLTNLSPTSIGSATIFVPAMERDRVWLINYPEGRIGQGNPSVWQVYPNGAVLGEPVVIEHEGLPAIGIPGGLALETDEGIALWNSESGEVSGFLGSGTTHGFVSDVLSDGRLAWCEGDCESLHVTNLSTGEEQEISLPDEVPPEIRGFDPRSARFANDFRFLASTAGGQVLVTDLQTSTTRAVFSGDARYEFLAWAPFGPELFAASYGYGQGEVDVGFSHVISSESFETTLPYGGTLGFEVVDTTLVRPVLSRDAFNGCSVTLPEGELFVPPDTHPPTPSEGLFWYGSDDLWTALPIDGDYGPRKSVWWSANFPGGFEEEDPDVQVEWRELGSATTVQVTSGPGTNAHTANDGWFMIAHQLDVRAPGCWEVTATYKGATLSYVYYKGN